MRIFATVLVLTVLTGCIDDKKKEIDLLGEEVIKLHDEVMPMMDDLYQMRMQLQKKLTTLTTEEDSTKVLETIVVLQNAEEHMMNWMRNFNPGYEGANTEETIQYLLDQKNAIQVVSKQMTKAKGAGQALLNRK
jgi:outer membrane murein-binding lipoprotein Lpp